MTPTTPTTEPETYLKPVDIARRLKVCRATVDNWLRGIRVGGTTIRLECQPIGSKVRVTEHQLARFLADCRRARLGDQEATGKPGPETPTEFRRRAKRIKTEALAACGVMQKPL